MRSLFFLALTTIALAACDPEPMGRRDGGIDASVVRDASVLDSRIDSRTTADSSASNDATSDRNASLDASASCWASHLALGTPYTVAVATLQNRFTSSGGNSLEDCASALGDFAETVDAAVLFTAPFTGSFVFSTRTSSPETLNTMIYLRDACSAATDIACNNDFTAGSRGTSETSAVMLAGQSLLVVADVAALSGSGNLVITVREDS